MANVEIRKAAQASGIWLWQVAYALGITDATFSRKLRVELPEVERKRILELIDQLREGNRR